eukprot:2829957-Pyramimonas_sp.AAC.1
MITKFGNYSLLPQPARYICTCNAIVTRVANYSLLQFASWQRCNMDAAMHAPSHRHILPPEFLKCRSAIPHDSGGGYDGDNNTMDMTTMTILAASADAD